MAVRWSSSELQPSPTAPCGCQRLCTELTALALVYTLTLVLWGHYSRGCTCYSCSVYIRAAVSSSGNVYVVDVAGL
jgi:hypothetical protein